MQKSSVQNTLYCSLLKPKIPQHRKPNGRNTKGSSITINFHFKLGWINLFKSKKICKFLQTCFTAQAHMLKLHLHAKSKAWVFANQVCSHFNGLGFTNHSKSWIQPHSDNVHYHLCFLSPGNCFKLVIYIQNLCESTTVITFLQRLKEEKIIHQKGLRTLYSLIQGHSKANKTLICIFFFLFEVPK